VFQIAAAEPTLLAFRGTMTLRLIARVTIYTPLSQLRILRTIFTLAIIVALRKTAVLAALGIYLIASRNLQIF
tara:strand:- start:133 stop:351 length:219 start_codon:yes stop_codon:yes gene_type:complete